MTVKSATTFDVEAFKRAYEGWDIEGLLAPVRRRRRARPDRPRQPSELAARAPHKDVFKGMFEHCATAGVTATVENTVAGPGRAAATVTCEFPGGRKVLANSILEIQDGRIICERDVLSGDPKGS